MYVKISIFCPSCKKEYLPCKMLSLAYAIEQPHRIKAEDVALMWWGCSLTKKSLHSHWTPPRLWGCSMTMKSIFSDHTERTAPQARDWIGHAKLSPFAWKWHEILLKTYTYFSDGYSTHFKASKFFTESVLLRGGRKQCMVNTCSPMCA